MKTVVPQRPPGPLARLIWPLAGVGGLLLFNLIFDRGFFELSFRDGQWFGPMVSVWRLAAKVMLLATGMTLVIATGGVDLSVGAVMAVTGSLVAFCAAQAGWSFGGLLALALAVAAVAGLFNGLLIAWTGLQPIVATLILMVLGRGVALMITGSLPVAVQHPLLLTLGRGHFLGAPLPIGIAVGITALVGLACRRTALGLFLEAVGENENASRLAGVPTRRVKLLAYLVCAVCASLAALVTIGDVGRVEPDRLGQLLELDAITAVVVGGTALTGGRFTLAGSLVGAVLIQTLTTTLTRQGMPSDLTPIPKALVILVVCLFQVPALRGKLAAMIHQERPAA